MPKKRWSELSSGQRRTIVVTAALEVVLTTAALVDIARRPPTQVRGPKVVWVLGMLVQPIGPLAYLTVGRRPTPVCGPDGITPPG